jgi:hypothetical protein
MNVSTGLLPVYTKGEGTEGPVVHRLTRFFLRERIGRVRVDVDVRSSTGLLGLSLIMLGANEETDSTYTESAVLLAVTQSGVTPIGVSRMTAFADLDTAIAGLPIVAFAVKCWNTAGEEIELALVSLDIHTMQAV